MYTTVFEGTSDSMKHGYVSKELRKTVVLRLQMTHGPYSERLIIIHLY